MFVKNDNGHLGSHWGYGSSQSQGGLVLIFHFFLGGWFWGPFEVFRGWKWDRLEDLEDFCRKKIHENANRPQSPSILCQTQNSGLWYSKKATVDGTKDVGVYINHSNRTQKDSRKLFLHTFKNKNMSNMASKKANRFCWRLSSRTWFLQHFFGVESASLWRWTKCSIHWVSKPLDFQDHHITSDDISISLFEHWSVWSLWFG